MTATPGSTRRGVVFRPLRYGHAIEAKEIMERITAGSVGPLEMDNFVFGLVAKWDYADIETGASIPLDQPRLLSLEQYNDLMAEFNRQMEGGGSVNPQNGVSSSSGLTPSRRVRRNSQTPQPG